MASIVLHEVGPRDGLQAEARVVPTEQKLAWIRAVAAAGVDVVQVGSFVRADRVPQLADTGELFRALRAEKPAAVLSALVLNEQGLERAVETGAELLCMGVSASDTHSRRNTGMTSAEAERRVVAMAARARAAGREVQAAVQCAFGCAFEGRVPEERVLALVEAYAAAGVTRLSLADTAGHAYPEQVERLFGEVVRRVPGARCACHFHDPYGLGLANVYAARRCGVTLFETSFAGLGGCPFAEGAAGNVATEDLVHALQRAGERSDVRLGALVDVARSVAAFFGRELPGRVQRLGPLPR